MVWLEVSNEVAGQMVGAAVSISKVVHSHGCPVGAGCWQEALLSSLMGLSAGLLKCPHSMAAGLPRSEWSMRPRQKLQCLFWSGLGSQTQSFLPYSIGHTEQLWISFRRDYSRSWIPGGEDQWGPSRRLPPTAFLHPSFPVCSAIPVCMLHSQAGLPQAVTEMVINISRLAFLGTPGGRNHLYHKSSGESPKADSDWPNLCIAYPWTNRCGLEIPCSDWPDLGHTPSPRTEDRVGSTRDSWSGWRRSGSQRKKQGVLTEPRWMVVGQEK